MTFPHPLNLKNWIMIKNFLSSFPKYFPLKFAIKNLKSRRVKMIEVLSNCINNEHTTTTIIVLSIRLYLLEVVLLTHTNGIFLVFVVKR